MLFSKIALELYSIESNEPFNLFWLNVTFLSWIVLPRERKNTGNVTVSVSVNMLFWKIPLELFVILSNVVNILFQINVTFLTLMALFDQNEYTLHQKVFSVNVLFSIIGLILSSIEKTFVILFWMNATLFSWLPLLSQNKYTADPFQ